MTNSSGILNIPIEPYGSLQYRCVVHTFNITNAKEKNPNKCITKWLYVCIYKNNIFLAFRIHKIRKSFKVNSLLN